MTGQLDKAIAEALAARDIQQETRLTDEWNAAVPLMLLRVYPCLAWRKISRTPGTVRQFDADPILGDRLPLPSPAIMGRIGDMMAFAGVAPGRADA